MVICNEQSLAAASLILASSSPRRHQLLTDAGYAFSVIEPTLCEPSEFGPSVQPVAQAEALSYFKARSVANSLESGIVLGADTIAANNGVVFGKADDINDARRILSTLAGTEHDVITGITLIDASTNKRVISHEVTAVRMRTLSDAELDAYLESRAWEGKAGAYGIQDEDDPFVESISGSFSNVVGLPIERLPDLFQAIGQHRGSEV